MKKEAQDLLERKLQILAEAKEARYDINTLLSKIDRRRFTSFLEDYLDRCEEVDGLSPEYWERALYLALR